MVSALPATVVIECPHCGTQYQLPPEAIGPKGRKVACAHCGETWQATARMPEEPPKGEPRLDPAAERELDDAFEAAAKPDTDDMDAARERTIAEIKAAIAPKPKPPEKKPDPVVEKKRQKAFEKRLIELSRQLPLAKVRRGLRIVSVSLLAILLVAAVAWRTDIVRQFPDLAGAYAALGLGVNVVGLEFRDVKTLITLKGTAQVMRVDAHIASVAAQSVTVPAVAVTLLDEKGAPIYEWSVQPDAHSLRPGEMVNFTTQLSSPPGGATQVRLTFTDGTRQAQAPVVPAHTASE